MNIQRREMINIFTTISTKKTHKLLPKYLTWPFYLVESLLFIANQSINECFEIVKWNQSKFQKDLHHDIHKFIAQTIKY